MNNDSIASAVEIDHTDDVKDDFIRMNLGDDSSESEDKFEDFTTPDDIESTICSLSSSQAPTTTVTTHHTRRQWSFEEKLKILAELNEGISLHALVLKYKCTRKIIRF